MVAKNGYMYDTFTPVPYHTIKSTHLGIASRALDHKGSSGTTPSYRERALDTTLQHGLDRYYDQVVICCRHHTALW